MFKFLHEVNRRPAPFEEYSAPELWTDSYTAQKMLDYHLDSSIDAASRNLDFIERSVNWIVTHFGLGAGAKVADFGCGPGLYTTGLAAAGFDVTGIDFSANSLKYARAMALNHGLDISYVEADYLEFEGRDRCDLIIMIMCDFCALSPEKRSVLLRKINSMLGEGGSFLLDVYSPRMYESREESATYAPNLMDGFWAAGEYYGFLNTFKYDEERLLLDKYTIVENDCTRCIYNWFQCFTPEELKGEFSGCGFNVVEQWGDVAGSEYDPDGSEFAVVAKKD